MKAEEASPELRELRARTAGYMDAIVAMFTPPVTITVCVRDPTDTSGRHDFMMTDDADIEALIAMIRRRHAARADPRQSIAPDPPEEPERT